MKIEIIINDETENIEMVRQQIINDEDWLEEKILNNREVYALGARLQNVAFGCDD